MLARQSANRSPRPATTVHTAHMQTAISCVPEDGFDAVLDIDNETGDSNTMTFETTVGTAFSTAHESMRSVSESVSGEMGFQLLNIFSESLKVSSETGYDWTRASSRADQRELTLSLTATAPGHTRVTFEQAVGRCVGPDVDGGDDDVVRTEMFRVTTFDYSTGETRVR